MKTLRRFQSFLLSSLLLLCVLPSGQAAAYVEAFFRNLHWEAVSSRLDKALKARALWAAGEAR
jgi:hypothetical protein